MIGFLTLRIEKQIEYSINVYNEISDFQFKTFEIKEIQFEMETIYICINFESTRKNFFKYLKHIEKTFLIEDFDIYIK